MRYLLSKNICYAVTIIMICFLNVKADTTDTNTMKEYDYSFRQRECRVRIVTPDSIPIPQLLVGFTLLNHHPFIFGGTINSDGFEKLDYIYGELFESYFDAGAIENEISWKVTKGSQEGTPDFSKADFLINWMTKKRLSVYAQTLFSNEKEEYLPEWVRNRGPSDFKLAMQERINTTVEHFKGKVNQWDIINAISHGESGLLPSPSLLQKKSGDSTIFKWILEESRKIDSVSEFVITDYNILNSSGLSAADEFINTVKPISNNFDIIGLVAHLGKNIDKDSINSKINYVAEKLQKPILLTDVDFTCDTSEAADKLEELMRICFSNPNVRGIIMGSWHQRYLRDSSITSYFVDSLNEETTVGKRWRDIIEEWKSSAGGRTDDSGYISFTGFSGKYQVWISCFIDTFYVEHGEGQKDIDVIYHHVEDTIGVKNKSPIMKIVEIRINGNLVPLKIPFNYKKQLFVVTYSLLGKQLARYPISLTGRSLKIKIPSSSAHLFRIETDNRVPLYYGKIVGIR